MVMRRVLLTAIFLAGAVVTGGTWVAAQTPPAMGGGMGMCPMGMGDADTRVDVKNVDKGVTITLTSTDPARFVRLQKMAEAMRLMHEAMSS
jgi:hypothetical protein